MKTHINKDNKIIEKYGNNTFITKSAFSIIYL